MQGARDKAVKLQEAKERKEREHIERTRREQEEKRLLGAAFKVVHSSYLPLHPCSKIALPPGEEYTRCQRSELYI